MKERPLGSEVLEPLIFEVRGHRVVLDSDRFSGDFAFQLTPVELDNLRSQFVTSRSQAVEGIEQKPNSSRFVTGSHGGRRYLPWVFTEHGALMAANVLRSDAEIDKTLLEHDSALRDLYCKLLPLLRPPAEPCKRSIGFLAKDD